MPWIALRELRSSNCGATRLASVGTGCEVVAQAASAIRIQRMSCSYDRVDPACGRATVPVSTTTSDIGCGTCPATLGSMPTRTDQHRHGKGTEAAGPAIEAGLVGGFKTLVS